MRRIVVFFLILRAIPTLGSHIVGGEFELLHVEAYAYRLNLILYFDLNNGNPGARDPNASVRIFRKSDNMPVMDVFLPFSSSSEVSYFQPECSKGEIRTDKLIYTTIIELSPDVFNDPGGYYISWQRCCRNYNITNIYSDEPGFGTTAGQTFYLEFPPVVRNGKQFINSSPQLFPPLNDYACPNRPYWVDFAGTDADGDSLVYTMVTPRNTFTSEAIPVAGPQPGPYPPVLYRPGFSSTNIMDGSPGLAISNNGFLTVTPRSSGLFVFAVRCEEYRNGEKIGELIRDFQMLVLTNCPVADPPLIRGKKLTEQEFTYVDQMDIAFSYGIADADRCIQVEVSDPDALKAEDLFTENIWLRVIPLGFNPLASGSVEALLPQISNATLVNGSVESFDICFPECPLINGPFSIGVIAFDDACALPLSDTLKINVSIEPPPNSRAYFVTQNATATLREGDDFQLPILGRDDDGDDLVVDILTNGFSLTDVGMSFDQTLNTAGEYTTTFNWQTQCDVFDFTERTEFLIKLLLNDADQCNFGDPDTLTLDLKVILPPNTDPVISTDLPQLSFIHRLREPLNFNVLGIDTDNDELELRAVPDGFNLAQYGISFPDANGVSQVSSAFSWTPGCSNIELDPVFNEAGQLLGYNKELQFYFVLNDMDKCKFPNFDSLDVKITLISPDNTAPAVSYRNLNDKVTIRNGTVDMIVGDELDMEVIANDPDIDNVTLVLAEDSQVPDGLAFTATSGNGVTESKLFWRAECTNLAEGFQPKSYTLRFVGSDEACYTAASDTTEIIITVRDKDAGSTDFIPANVFTPNDDGINDTYSLPGLPIDNCAGEFLSFRVQNRWGIDVYESIDRNFVWDGDGLEPSVYFYIIEFTNKQYTGTLSILY